MAQVRYSEEDDTKKVDWMFSAMAPHLLTDDGHLARISNRGFGLIKFLRFEGPEHNSPDRPDL